MIGNVSESANFITYWNTRNIANLVFDKSKQRGCSKGEFSVKSCYRILKKEDQQLKPWPPKQIWKSGTLHRGEARFSWIAAKEACLTTDKKGLHLCQQMLFMWATMQKLLFFSFCTVLLHQLWQRILNFVVLDKARISG